MVMQAVQISSFGGPEVLELVERPLPRPGPGEVLIEVAAAGVNRPDLLQRMGLYPPPPGASDLPGLEVSGRVSAVGDGVAWPWVGDEVCALVSGGGYASHCVAPAGQCLPVPAGVSVEDAASLPETYLTVWTNLFEDGRLGPGQTALVHGGAGGIGSAAILIAKAFDARVAVTARGAERCGWCRELGADLAIDYSSEDFVEAVKRWTQGRGVDVVLDMVGGPYVERNMACMAAFGRHVSIAFLQGPRAEVDLFQVMRKRLVLTGSTLRARSEAEKARLTSAVRRFVWHRFDGGGLKPMISHRLPLAEAAEAHRVLERGAQLGKVILVP